MTTPPQERTQTNPKQTQIRNVCFPNGRHQEPRFHPQPRAEKNEKTNPNLDATSTPITRPVAASRRMENPGTGLARHDRPFMCRPDPHRGSHRSMWFVRWRAAKRVSVDQVKSPPETGRDVAGLASLSRSAWRPWHPMLRRAWPSHPGLCMAAHGVQPVRQFQSACAVLGHGTRRGRLAASPMAAHGVQPIRQFQPVCAVLGHGTRRGRLAASPMAAHGVQPVRQIQPACAVLGHGTRLWQAWP